MTTSPFNGLRGDVITPEDPRYDEARRVWNGSIDRRPAFIVRPRDASGVAAAVEMAERHGLPLAVRGGGHSIPGHSVCDGGLVVDLGLMKDISFDGDHVDAGAGLLWSELDAATEQRGSAVPGGEISHTGIAGLTLGGGVGWLSRVYGLTCDNLVGAEVVLSDGSVVEADDELLWGLRGGGGNFGVVTRFRYRLNPIPVPMYAGMVLHPIERAPEALATMVELWRTAPDGVGLNAALVTAPPAPFVPPHLQGKQVVVLAANYVGDIAEGEELIRPLREFAAPEVDLFGPMPYTALQQVIDAAAPHGMQNHVRSEWLRGLDDAAVAAMIDVAVSSTSPMSQVLLRFMGGAIERVSPDATAFRFRSAQAMLTLAAVWPDPRDDGARHAAWTRQSWEAIQPWSAGGAYVNHLGNEGPDRVRQAYGEATWSRLVGLKRKYDPTNLFALNQNIPPE